MQVYIGQTFDKPKTINKAVFFGCTFLEEVTLGNNCEVYACYLKKASTVTGDDCTFAFNSNTYPMYHEFLRQVNKGLSDTVKVKQRVLEALKEAQEAFVHQGTLEGLLEAGKPKVILVGGKQRVGKDTFASMLHSMLPKSTIMSFAKPLKDMVYSLYPDVQGKQRDKLIAFGALARKFDPDVWVNQLTKSIPEDIDWVIIPDWRFDNELQCLLKDFTVIPVYVKTTRELQIARGADVNTLDDPSENGIQDYLGSCAHIDNTGTLEHLKNEAREFIAVL